MKLIKHSEYSEEEFNKSLRTPTLPIKGSVAMYQAEAIEMVKAMYAERGVGLAANQVGLKYRMCVIDPAQVVGRRLPIVMFNPEMVEHGEEAFDSIEGCLSLPGIHLKVPRFREVKVSYLDLLGKKAEIVDRDGTLLAAVLQHELDHLQGVMICDRAQEEVKLEFKPTLA